MAIQPTTTAAILPARTLPLSDICMPRKLSIRSWATAPEAATIKPETVPRTVAKASEDITANNTTPKERASSGADMLLSVRLITPLVMAPRPRNRVST